jgi:hypothetical protein
VRPGTAELRKPSRDPPPAADVIELWIENAVMLEIMTPEMSRDYLVARPRREGC